MALTKIAWTLRTWNFCTGCDKISDGCKNCYAFLQSMRLKNFGIHKYRYGFQIEIHPGELYEPYKWKKPSLIFVNSMSDLFHKDIPLKFIQDAFKVMNECPQHIFQVLTKRSERLEELSSSLNWTSNICCGVTLENSRYVYRIDNLRRTGAALKFLSIEPLLGPLPNINLSGIDWVICAGESGINFREMKHEWARDILHQCRERGIPFFFKQSAGFHKKDKEKLLDGVVYHEYPQLIKDKFFINIKK